VGLSNAENEAPPTSPQVAVLPADKQPNAMNTLSSIAISGMNAATARLGVSAHNVAHAVTPVFRRQEVLQQSQPGGGVTTQVTQASTPGHNLAADLVQQKVALYSFKANLRTVQVEHEMLGSLLDLKA
jgi:flagellar hook protein FlgE